MRTGLTMLELLLSISLLSLLMLAVASWTTEAARTQAQLSERTRWRRTADLALQVIADDLRLGDFGSSLRGPKASVRGHSLTVHTRDPQGWGAPGPVVRRYAHDQRSREVRVHEQRPGSTTLTRVLLGEVSTWDCTIDGGVLSVTLRSDRGESCNRDFRLP